jgi:hypothetical protein
VRQKKTYYEKHISSFAFIALEEKRSKPLKGYIGCTLTAFFLWCREVLLLIFKSYSSQKTMGFTALGEVI